MPRTCSCPTKFKLISSNPFSLQNSSSGKSKKRGRCKFCRSRAKYVPGQRSFDASRIFGRRRERAEPRRAVSEDRRSDGQTTEGKVNHDADHSHYNYFTQVVRTSVCPYLRSKFFKIKLNSLGWPGLWVGRVDH